MSLLGKIGSAIKNIVSPAKATPAPTPVYQSRAPVLQTPANAPMNYAPKPVEHLGYTSGSPETRAAAAGIVAGGIAAVAGAPLLVIAAAAIGTDILISNIKGSKNIAGKTIGAGTDLLKSTSQVASGYSPKDVLSNYVGEHPIFSTILGGLAVVTAAKYVAPVIASGINTAATRANTKALEGGMLGDPNAPVGKSDVGSPAVGSPSTSPSPMQTQELGKTTSGKRRKTRSKAQGQHISQSVRINIMNSNSAHRTNKYIREAIYA